MPREVVVNNGRGRNLNTFSTGATQFCVLGDGTWIILKMDKIVYSNNQGGSWNEYTLVGLTSGYPSITIEPIGDKYFVIATARSTAFTDEDTGWYFYKKTSDNAFSKISSGIEYLNDSDDKKKCASSQVFYNEDGTKACFKLAMIVDDNYDYDEDETAHEISIKFHKEGSNWVWKSTTTYKTMNEAQISVRKGLTCANSFVTPKGSIFGCGYNQDGQYKITIGLTRRLYDYTYDSSTWYAYNRHTIPDHLGKGIYSNTDIRSFPSYYNLETDKPSMSWVGYGNEKVGLIYPSKDGIRMIKPRMTNQAVHESNTLIVRKTWADGSGAQAYINTFSEYDRVNKVSYFAVYHILSDKFGQGQYSHSFIIYKIDKDGSISEVYVSPTKIFRESYFEFNLSLNGGNIYAYQCEYPYESDGTRKPTIYEIEVGTTIKAYHQGGWLECTPRVWHSGEWKDVNIKVYQRGTWKKI